MTYKESLTAAMAKLAEDPLVRFVGYGLKYGGMAGGTLKGIDPAKTIEAPTAENLMTSVAIGLSLKGLRPLVFFERCDFLVHALDAIVNHLDKMSEISETIYRPAAIIRVVIGNKSKPLFTGATHVQDLSNGVRQMVHFPVHVLEHKEDIMRAYECAHESMKQGISTVLFEKKDLI